MPHLAVGRATTVLFAAIPLVFCGFGSMSCPAADLSTGPAAVAQLSWLDDYGAALKQAELGRRLMLVYFYNGEPTEAQRRFETESLNDQQIVARLEKYVRVRLPLDYEVSVGGEVSKLLDHDAFRELKHRPGIAIIDYAHPDEEYYGYVVSILPLENGKYYRFDPRYLTTILDLPSGTLTQRTMIFAVRIHPEAPKSTRGRLSGILLGEAREHSRLQARILKQGHHNWSNRFQRITKLLPLGLRAQEVVAESWPGEGLMDAAIDCVDSWRQSPGHWGAVTADQPQYGYDIKRGDNGIWYATGLFGNGGES